MADIEVVDHGSLWQFIRVSDAGREWWDENVQDELGGFAEPRYGDAIVQGARADGLVVEVA